MANVLLIGFRDLGLPVGRAFLSAECGVAATTTDPAAARALAEAGITPIDADADQPDSLDGVCDGFDVVCLRLGAAPTDAVAAVLQGLPFELHRFVLLGTAEPALAAAEKMCLGAHRTQAVPTVVLRLGPTNPDDAGRAIVAAAERGEPGTVYDLSDGVPEDGLGSPQPS